MKNAQHVTIANNLLYLKETRRILSALEPDQVPVLLLKGIALVEWIYPHLGMRSMSDIDVLIKEKDLPVTSQRFEDLGYKLKAGTCPPTYIQEGKIRIIVELHTQIPYLSENKLWADVRPISMDGKAAYTLSLEQNIIYLCYHVAVSHANSFEYKWLEDIHRMCTHCREDIDWKALGNKIKSYRLEAPCYYTLIKTKDVFGSFIPDSFLSAIKPKRSLQAKIFQQIFDRRKPNCYPIHILPFLLSPRLIVARLFPSVRFFCQRYQTRPPFVYLYYMIRPACLFIKALPAIGRLCVLLLKSAAIHRTRPYHEKIA